MPERIVQLLEVVDIEHRYAKCRFAARGTFDLAVHGFVQSAPVERAGKLVFPHQFADLLQFDLEFLHAGICIVSMFLVAEQFIVCMQCAGLYCTRVVHHVLQNMTELCHVVGLAAILP